MTTKAELNALGKVFGAEVENRLPYQSKAKIFRKLCDDGLLQPMNSKFGTGMFAVTVSGYELTHAGRIVYCSSCDDDEE